MQIPLIRLQCGVNSYDWGKPGKTSAAARFASATLPPSTFSIESSKPYAELWMGTHPSLPSKDVETQRTLLDMVSVNKALVGDDVTQRFELEGKGLPFLFKVLSIGKALSIQAHPNKKLAEELHSKDPKNYPDDNHKPEMAIAITDFEGLCGFRPLEEITNFLDTVGPLRELIGDEPAKKFASAVKGHDESAKKQALRETFTSLMSSSQDSITKATHALLSSTDSLGPELSELIPRLNTQFPNDIGLFVLFFLNFVKLSPGEAMFLQADDIHAYISGDIIECMAASDNVVRAGFTPKFKDVKTLTSMLTYSYAPIEEQKMQPTPYPYVSLNATAYSSASSAILYDPPIEEFSVVKTELLREGAKATFESLEGPSVFICTKGKGTIAVGPKTEECGEGYVFFVGATAEVVLEGSGEEFTTFRAFCELSGKEGKGSS